MVFFQRKFPPLSFLGADTFYYLNPKIENIFIEPVLDGFATSISRYPVQETFFVLDEEIIAIEECQSIQIISTQNRDVSIPIGKYEDNKTIIQQQAIRSCKVTCAAMLIEDHGKSCDLKNLAKINSLTNAAFLNFLAKAGLEGIQTQIAATSHSLEETIKTCGSICLGVCDPQIETHQILLDAVNPQEATLRDPYHGWRITISTKKLLSLVSLINNRIEIIYVK